jgi:hypothetical protein
MGIQKGPAKLSSSGSIREREERHRRAETPIVYLGSPSLWTTLVGCVLSVGIDEEELNPRESSRPNINIFISASASAYTSFLAGKRREARDLAL